MSTIAAIHVGRRELGLDEDTARDVYEQATGKRSLRAMTEPERKKVLAALNRKGFKRSSKRSQKPLTGPYAKKLQALWIAGWNLGLVRNRDDKALLAFVKRQTGLEHTQFLHDAANATKVIEALKGWLAREGGVDWEVDQIMRPFVRTAGCKIACAQMRLINPNIKAGDVLDEVLTEVSFQLSLSGDRPDLEKEGDWIPVMNALGRQVRDKRSRR
ncbi:MAG: regulatory protein GemA [Pseudomonadota bacterium]